MAGQRCLKIVNVVYHEMHLMLKMIKVERNVIIFVRFFFIIDHSLNVDANRINYSRTFAIFRFTRIKLVRLRVKTYNDQTRTIIVIYFISNNKFAQNRMFRILFNDFLRPSCPTTRTDIWEVRKPFFCFLNYSNHRVSFVRSLKP